MSKVYKIKVNEFKKNEGIEFISCVDFPAIEANWVALSQAKQVYLNSERQILYGAILIPDKPILRYDDKGEEYYIVFEKPEIEKLVRKFQKDGKAVNLNYQHESNSKIENLVVQEIWLTGKNDKSNHFGFKFPEGTAMVGVHVGDKEFWDTEVKTGNVKGFSIEGWLDMEIKNSIKMNEVKLTEAMTSTGMVIKTDAESWEVGAAVYTVNEAGEQVALEPAEYELENGTILVIGEGSVIAEIREAEQIDEAMAQVIQKAVEPVTQALSKQIEALTEKLTALEVKMSNQPGQPVKKEEPKPVALSGIEKVKQLINNKNK